MLPSMISLLAGDAVDKRTGAVGATGEVVLSPQPANRRTLAAATAVLTLMVSSHL